MNHQTALWWSVPVATLILAVVTASSPAQTASWSAPKAARAAAAAANRAMDSKAPAAVPLAAETASPALLSPAASVTQPACPIIVVVPSGAQLPSQLQALLNSGQPNAVAETQVLEFPTPQATTQRTTALTPANPVVAVPAPLRPQSDPDPAGERRLVQSAVDQLAPVRAQTGQPGEGGIFKWPSGMRIEYAEPPQPAPQSPLAKRSRALFRQPKDKTSAPVPPVSSANGRGKALLGRLQKPSATLGGVAAQSQLAISANVTPQGRERQATAAVAAAPNASGLQVQSRALFAKRPAGSTVEDTIIEWLQASEGSSKALFAQAHESSSTRLPTVAVATAALPDTQQTASVANEHSAASEQHRSKALFDLSRRAKLTDQDSLKRFMPHEHGASVPVESIAPTLTAPPAPATKAQTNEGATVEKSSKALIPKSLFVRSPVVPSPPPPSVIASPNLAPVATTDRTGDAVVEGPLVPQAASRPVSQNQLTSSSSGDGRIQARSNAASDSAGDKVDWKSSKRRPKTPRQAAANKSTEPTEKANAIEIVESDRSAQEERTSIGKPDGRVTSAKMTVELPPRPEPAVIVPVAESHAAQVAVTRRVAIENCATLEEDAKTGGEQLMEPRGQMIDIRAELARNRALEPPAAVSELSAKKRAVVVTPDDEPNGLDEQVPANSIIVSGAGDTNLQKPPARKVVIVRDPELELRAARRTNPLR